MSKLGHIDRQIIVFIIYLSLTKALLDAGARVLAIEKV